MAAPKVLLVLGAAGPALVEEAASMEVCEKAVALKQERCGTFGWVLKRLAVVRDGWVSGQAPVHVGAVEELYKGWPDCSGSCDDRDYTHAGLSL